MLVTPICPHSLGVRPLILSDDVDVELVVHEVGDGATLTADGQVATPLEFGDRLTCHLAPPSVNLVKFSDSNFFQVLRQKLHWGMARELRPNSRRIGGGCERRRGGAEMLLELRIGNLALAEDVVLRPGAGLTVLTGETGAGKSLVAGALGLLIGGKAERGLVRAGEDEAWVEAVCDLSAARPAAAVRRLGVSPATTGCWCCGASSAARAGAGCSSTDALSSQAVLEAVWGRCSSPSRARTRSGSWPPAGFARDFLDDVLALAAARARRWPRRSPPTSRRHGSWPPAATRPAWPTSSWTCGATSATSCGRPDLREDEEPELAEAIAVKRHAQAMLEAAALAREQLERGPAPARDLLGRAQAALTPHVDKSSRLAVPLTSNCSPPPTLVAEAASELERFLDAGFDPTRATSTTWRSARRSTRNCAASTAGTSPGLLALAEDLDRALARQVERRGRPRGARRRRRTMPRARSWRTRRAGCTRPGSTGRRGWRRQAEASSGPSPCRIWT